MIGIIGHGVLGKAMAHVIGGAPAIYDPGAGYPDDSVLDDAELIFVCVPTPMDFATGKVDLSCVHDAFCRISPGKTVVIRSTVPPGTTDALQHERPDLSIHFVPEFLREKHAIYDAMCPTRIVIGSCAGRHNGQVVDIFERANPRVPIITTDAKTAEMYKYACNALLAFQISAANEIERISDALGVDYDLLRRWFQFDSRLGTMNQVPGHDGLHGFGGKCFPKDCAGLLAHSNAHGYDAPLLRAMIDFNNAIREEKDWLNIPGAVSVAAGGSAKNAYQKYTKRRRTPLMPRLKIITWLWSQPNARFAYTAGHVNAWATAMRANCTRDVSFACVTDQPDGLLDWIEAIPIPQDFIDCKTDQWKESSGLPQCYRRLAMFAPDAKNWIGADRWISMDLDCIVVGNIDHLIDRKEDFLIFRGTSSRRPCNGGFIIMNNGARPQLYNDFSVENARIASSKFVGSDQAWIAYCLSGYSEDWRSGWTETRVGEAEGIYHYSPRFIRTHGGRRFRPPHNLAILFCPGVEKFFCDGSFHNAPDEMQRNVRMCMETKPGKLLALKDSKGWAALAAKHSGAEIITSTDQAQPGDAVLVRMRCNGPEKAETLEAVKALNARGIKTLPTMQEALWYDDKIAQYDALKKWMPQTWIFTTRKEAVNFSESATFPLIRKLSHGASSCNVSLIKNKSTLKKSITDAFRRGGDGYIYLQEYIRTDCDYRINISGRYLYGKTRYIRSEDEPFASGSGLNSVMYFTDPLERQRKAALLAVEIAREIGIHWACFDFVWDGSGMKVLEMSSAWRADWYEDCPLHYHDLKPTGKMGSEYFSEIRNILGVSNEPKQKTSIDVRANTNGASYMQKRCLQIMLENVYQMPVVLVQDDDAELGHDCIVVADPRDTTKRVYRFSERHERLRAGIPADCSFIKFDSDIKPWSQELRGYHIKLSKYYREVMKRCR